MFDAIACRYINFSFVLLWNNVTSTININQYVLNTEFCLHVRTAINFVFGCNCATSTKLSPMILEYFKLLQSFCHVFDDLLFIMQNQIVAKVIDGTPN
jgi:hypothetical protein